MELIFIIIFLLSIFISVIMQNRNNKTHMEYQIRNNFGKERTDIDDQLERLDMIEKLYLTEKEHYSDKELVDDITWDDLNMNHVFASVNHTTSFVGEQYLYTTLHHFPSSTHLIDTREALIQHFDAKEKTRFAVQRCLYALRKDYSNYYIPSIMERLELHKIPFCKITIFLSLSLITLGIVGLITRHAIPLALFIGNYIVNIVLNTFWKMKFDINMVSIFTIAKTIDTARSIKSLTPEFHSNISNDIHSLNKVTKMARYIAQKKTEMTTNEIYSLMSAYIFGAFLTDYILYDKILTELIGKQDAYMRIYKYIGEIDCSISIASYRRSVDTYCVPIIAQDKTINFDEVRHPLISDAVANDFSFDRNIIITGSNASGKSTFIKSVAINLIIGQTLLTCTAEHAIIPTACVLTSMAVRDDVVTGESYYIREIKYLKRMIERSAEGQMLFLAIDEILRGTNTKERIAASKAVMEYFKDKNCILMVATHDLELACYLDNTYDNYYFCETIKDGDVIFDYTLRKGISKTSNAIRLLEAIGFPEVIVKNARIEMEN